MSDWSQDSADLFAAGRTIDEPSAEDRDRVALRIAARVAVAGGGAAVLSLGTPMAAAPAAISKVGTALSLGKVLLSLAVGVGAVSAVTTAVVVIAHAPAATLPAQLQVQAPTSAPATTGPTDRRTASTPVPPPEPIEPAVVPAVTVAVPVAVTVPVVAPAIASAPAHVVSAPVASSTPTTATAAATATATATSTATSTSAIASPPAEDTATEARLVRGIDDALRHHDVSTAQRLLDEHDATFPRGHFTEECAAARVLARCDGQPTEDARRAACTFFSQHPHSPTHARIEDACSPRCE